MPASVARAASPPAFEVRAAEREEPVERVGVGVGELRLVTEAGRERVHLLRGVGDTRAPREVVAERLALSRVGLLRQVADRAGAHDPSSVGRFEPRKDAQERRLADPVRTDDADPVARRDDERDAPQHVGGAEALRYLMCGQGAGVCPVHGTDLLQSKGERRGFSTSDPS